MIASVVISNYFIDKEYSSQTQLIVDTPQTDQLRVNGNAVVNNLQLVNTYKDFVKSDMVIESAANEYKRQYGKDLSLEGIVHNTEVLQSTNSQMFSVKVVSKNPIEAKRLADILSDVFLQKLTGVLSGAKVTLISKGAIPTVPEFPQQRYVLSIGAVSGFIVALFIMAISVFSGVQIRSKNFIINEYNYVALGEINYIKKKEQKELNDLTKESTKKKYLRRYNE
jgi:Capsular polysaccharide biosynthesis protein